MVSQEYFSNLKPLDLSVSLLKNEKLCCDANSNVGNTLGRLGIPKRSCLSSKICYLNGVSGSLNRFGAMFSNSSWHPRPKFLENSSEILALRVMVR